MDKYRVVYDTTGGGHHPMSIEIEASSVIEDDVHVIFFDKYGEDEAVFMKKDVISYYTIEDIEDE